MKKNELAYEFDGILIALSKMDSKERIFEFMLDLLTEKEILEFSRRFEVAKMLEDGISYARIEKKTSMSSTTIARVSKALNSENMGYRNALNIVSGI
ncbi:MAG: YerC/YecD family TrpR-related protein [Candidatus Gracilibacteria bacterium]|nr:YerC/YecD family TrpR-related protein [Candidatus Gracilibacteria bacterium]